jgi:hypothetical protein
MGLRVAAWREAVNKQESGDNSRRIQNLTNQVLPLQSIRAL